MNKRASVAGSVIEKEKVPPLYNIPHSRSFSLRVLGTLERLVIFVRAQEVLRGSSVVPFLLGSVFGAALMTQSVRYLSPCVVVWTRDCVCARYADTGTDR